MIVYIEERERRRQRDEQRERERKREEERIEVKRKRDRAKERETKWKKERWDKVATGNASKFQLYLQIEKLEPAIYQQSKSWLSKNVQKDFSKLDFSEMTLIQSLDIIFP